MTRLQIRGASRHNLKNVDVDIPKNALTVVTGVSGSGKSSLVIDTLHREAQRAYLGMLTFGRQGPIRRMESGQVRDIRNLSPSVAVHQRFSRVKSDLSLAVISGLDADLRTLMAKLAKPICPRCGRVLRSHSPAGILQLIYRRYRDQKVTVYGEIRQDRPGDLRPVLRGLGRRGFLKVRVQGQTYDLDQPFPPTLPEGDRFLLKIDVIRAGGEQRSQLLESLQLADHEANGRIFIEVPGGGRLFTRHLYCPRCDLSLAPLRPESLNPAEPDSACPDCRGTGRKKDGPCLKCRHTGLKRQVFSFTLGNRTWADLMQDRIGDLRVFFSRLRPPRGKAKEREIAKILLARIRKKMIFFRDLHLEYLGLDRRAGSLSTGELQRARLVGQMGGELNHLLLLLDEPTVGLHPSEQMDLARVLRRFCRSSNTVVVIEHDRAILEAADFLVFLGPGPGHNGGRVMIQDFVKKVRRDPNPVIRSLLSSTTPPNSFKTDTIAGDEWIRMENLSLRNVRNLTLSLRKTALNVVTGISGSGKSTLVTDLFYPRVKQALDTGQSTGNVQGLEGIGQVRLVRQAAAKPGGESLVISFFGLMGFLRELFSRLKESRVRGYGKERFSLGRPGGRCPGCRGRGYLVHRMQNMVRFRGVCPECRGKRYNPQTLQVRYHGHSIARILDMEFQQLGRLFKNIPVLSGRIHRILEMGLGYLKAGQQMNSLSGGEGQRVMLCRELLKSGRGPTIFIFDEPTTGLHPSDIRDLMAVFKGLIQKGDTLVVIEHHPDVILEADHLIDLGPGAGSRGGRVLFEGNPRDVVKCKRSLTGRYLAEVLNGI